MLSSQCFSMDGWNMGSHYDVNDGYCATEKCDKSQNSSKSKLVVKIIFADSFSMH